LVAFAAVILSRANTALAPLQNHSRSLSWVVVGYCVLATIANAATPSKRQRNLWLPVVVLMLLLSLVVALS
jgi:cell division protein FtsW (lipid II flippase)